MENGLIVRRFSFNRVSGRKVRTTKWEERLTGVIWEKIVTLNESDPKLIPVCRLHNLFISFLGVNTETKSDVCLTQMPDINCLTMSDLLRQKMPQQNKIFEIQIGLNK